MNLPQIIGDVFEDEKAMVCSSVDLLDYDNYKEWFESTYPVYLSAKEPPKSPLESNRFGLVKKELEKIFQERARITEEELHPYVASIMSVPAKRSIFIYLLIIYIDFYHEDADYKKGLVESVIKYFDITKEEMKGARNGWEPEWVKEESASFLSWIKGLCLNKVNN